MRRLILLSLILITKLSADVTQVVVLQKQRSGGDIQSVYLIGNKHVFANKIAESEQSRYAARADKAADIVLDAFKKEPTDKKTFLIEAHFPFYDESARSAIDPLYCQCYLQKVKNCEKVAELIRMNAHSNDDTNILEVLAEKAQGIKGVLFPDKRGILLNLPASLKGVVELPEASEEEYNECKAFFKKNIFSVKQFFATADDIISELILNVNRCIKLLANDKNKDSAYEDLEYIKSLRNSWKDFQKELNFPPSQSMAAAMLDHVRDLGPFGQSLLLHTIEQLDGDGFKMSDAFDYMLLKTILHPQATSVIFVATGFLHTGSLLSILLREGYRIVYDSKTKCFGTSFATTQKAISDCAKAIEDIDLSTLKAVFRAALEKEEHTHEEL
jgi:hypothetical protein